MSDDTESLGDDEMTPQEWADGLAQTVGLIWLKRWPSGKDWQ